MLHVYGDDDPSAHCAYPYGGMQNYHDLIPVEGTYPYYPNPNPNEIPVEGATTRIKNPKAGNATDAIKSFNFDYSYWSKEVSAFYKNSFEIWEILWFLEYVYPKL